MNETKSMPSSPVKQYAGNPFVRSDGRASAATPSRGAILYKVNWIGSMKYVLAIIVSLVFGRIFAYTETVDGYKWTYRINGDTAEIFNNWDTAISPFPTNAVTIPSVLGGKPVTSIGDYALVDCDELTSVMIPNSVKSIGAGAFAFCEEMESVSIPSSVRSIGREAFHMCSGLTSVTIPNGVTSIGFKAFDFCGELKSVTIPSSVTCIGDRAFDGCNDSLFDTNSIPGVKLVDGWAIGKTGPLSGVLDLTGVRGIGDQVFCGCNGLTSVKIPDSVKSIGKNAFADCEGLTNVIIGNGGPSIGEGAFSSCGRLTNVTIGNGATSIGVGAFMECTNLTSVTIGNGATTIGFEAFSNCEKLESVTIGDGLTSIGSAAFWGCANLKDLNLPDSVTSIGDYAFFGCTSLENVPSPGSAGHTEDVADTIWTPAPVGLTLEGEPCVEGKHFLVAGSNATARVVLEDYSGKWKKYDLYGSGVTGTFRHTIKKILVLGYAAAELNDIPESKAVKMFKQGTTTSRDLGGDSTALCERATGFFTSPARHDIEITANVEKIDDDGEAYRIVSIAINGENKCLSVPRDLWPKETGRDGVFEFPFMLPWGSGWHGQYYWTAFVVYKHEWSIDGAVTGTSFTDIVDEDEWDDDDEWIIDILSNSSNIIVIDEALNSPHADEIMTKGLAAQLLITNEMGRVFFDKYGKDDDTNPNWFKYWKEDGACPSLSMSNIVLDPTLSGYGEASVNANEIAINPKIAAETHYDKVCRVSSPRSYDFSGPHIWGIYSVEEVVAHENQHLDRYRAYNAYFEEYNKSSGWGRLPDWMLGKEKDSDWHFDSVTKTQKEYWKSPVPIETRNGVCDFKRIEYCDHLRDVEEKGLPYLFDSLSTDTYNLAAAKGIDEYTAYGDDEFLAMMAANKATKEWRAVLTNDWAFPGEQSYVPAIVSACRAGLKYTQPNNWPNGWNPPELAHVAIDASQSIPQSQLISSTKGIHLVADSVEENPSITIDRISKNIEYDSDDGFASAICYGIFMTVKGLNELHLNGTIVDNGGHAIAYANAIVSKGVCRAELRFDGKAIYESAGERPYRLGQISLVEFGGIDYSELATLSEFTNVVVDLRREDFARNDAYLLDVVDETVTTNGLVVSVNVEVNTAGEYDVSATLVNTSGVSVASSSVSMNCMQGTNRVSMVFPASKIRQSGIDGPYDIDNIVLSKDGTRIDSRLHFYSTRKMYRSAAFRFGDGADFNPINFMSQFADYTPPSELPPPEWFWVFFNPNGGTISETAREVKDGDKVGTLPIPSRENNKFLGWYTELEGGAKITDSTKVTTNIMLHAHWEYDGSVVVSAEVAEDCEGMGTVSGGGKAVKAGTKVTLKATAKKGNVFVEWRDDKGVAVSQSVSYTYVAADEDVTLTAVFATTAADEESLKVAVEDVVTGEDGTIGTLGADGTWALDLGACVTSLSSPKIAVSGLPAGLKYDAKTMKITGKATKPGVYAVTVTATNASATGKKAVVGTFNITVPNLRWDEEAVGVALEDRYLLPAGIAPALSNEVAAIAGAGWKLAVSGLPSGVKFDAKKGAISGIATKEGFFTVYFTATRGSGKTAEKQVATATFEVAFPTLTLAVAAHDDAGATNRATVAGGGRYPFGKKVTLKATAAKGNVFSGWYDGEGGLVAQTASYPYVTTDEDVALTAVFVTGGEDKASIAANVDGRELAPWVSKVETHAFVTNVWAGVYLEWPVAAEALSATTIKVSGLPSGLKFTAKPVTGKVGSGKAAVIVTNVPANTIYGAPTAASKADKYGTVKPSEVKVTVTTAGKSSQTYQIDTVVEALPVWAVGTFDGVMGNGELGTGNGGSASAEATADERGTATLTIAANGKISGKLLRDDGTWTLAASAFDSVRRVADNAPYQGGATDEAIAFVATVVGKSGKLLETNEVTVSATQVELPGGYGLRGVANGSSLPSSLFPLPTSLSWTAYQNLWKRADTKEAMPVFKTDRKVDHWLGGQDDVSNMVTLTFKKEGVVSFAGKADGVKVSGSSQLVWDDSDLGGTAQPGWRVTLYAPPKGAFAGFRKTLAVTLTIEANIVTAVTVE